MGDAHESVLALKAALDRVGGDRRYLAEMLGCFLVDLEGYLREARSAAPGEEVLRRVGASIEERATEVGAQALALSARRLAEGAAATALEGVDAEVGRLAEAVASLERTVR